MRGAFESAGPISAAYGVSDKAELSLQSALQSRDLIYRVSEIDLSISLGARNTSTFVPIVFFSSGSAAIGGPKLL